MSPTISPDLLITITDLALMGFLLVLALLLARLRDLFAVVMVAGLYSLTSALIFTALDAVDVAITEASVGAGISTVLMLAALSQVPQHERRPRSRRPRWGSWSVLALMLAALLYGTADMPAFGDATAPSQTAPVTRYYLEKAPQQTGVPNVVTAVLASYRGYDTLGETTVVFTALLAVLLLLRRETDPPAQGPSSPLGPTSPPLLLRDFPIVRVASKALFAPILLFAFYVQFHGDFGPGGGFQAGVIFAAAIVLMGLLHDLRTVQAVFRPDLTLPLAALGVVIYSGTGLVSWLLGGAFLDYTALNPQHPAQGQVLGIFLVELGVGITVASVMIALFLAFVERAAPSPAATAATSLHAGDSR